MIVVCKAGVRACPLIQNGNILRVAAIAGALLAVGALFAGAHDALTAPSLIACPNCGEMRLPHTVCPNCGQYKGREVIPQEEKKK